MAAVGTVQFLCVSPVARRSSERITGPARRYCDLKMEHITKISDDLYMVTTKAPVNIAVVKYWGKTNEELIIPANDSLSLTLHIDHLCAKTTVAVGRNFRDDRIWLNGNEERVNTRIQNCLKEIRRRSRTNDIGLPNYSDWHVHICSINNFPTAAGVASSAAGYACLVKALGTLFHVKGDLSAIARRGSGSACRSMYGGYVAWLKGSRPDGEDSVARQIAPETHWPQMRAVVLVVSDTKKDTASTQGMGISMLTSTLLEHRVAKVVPQRMEDIKEAIINRNFHKFAEITMQESNQLHAVCLDTYPPIRYMNLISWDIVHLVHRYNKYYGVNKLAYSFDAGPNACLFMLEDSLAQVLSIVRHAFPSSLGDSDFFRGMPAVRKEPPVELLASLRLSPRQDALKFAIVTRVGCGPECLNDPEEHILDVHGFPR